MKNVFPLLLLVIFISCSNTSTEKSAASNISSSTQNESPSNDAKASASIKIFKDDKLLFEYKAQFPKGGIVTYKDGQKELILNLGSDDNANNLIVTVEKAATGSLSIGKADAGEVHIQLTTEGKGPVPFLTNLTEGTFKISLSGETCSGSFTGSQKEQYVDNIRITGDFTSIPLIKETSKY